MENKKDDRKNVSASKTNEKINPINKKVYFNFGKLVKTFLEICPDFIGQKSLKTTTVSQRFADSVIFKYSKEIKVAKSKGQDETWNVRLETTDAKGKLIVNFVNISTYFFKPPPVQQPILVDNHLNLTFKQASLLAVAKYCELIPLFLANKHEIALTPLAGAVFSKESLPKLAEVLSSRAGSRISVCDVLIAIIASCQTDGHYLAQSRCHIAVVALNRTIANLEQRESIIKKTIKMYKMQGKEFNMEIFMIYEKHARDDVRFFTEIAGIRQSPHKPIDTGELNNIVKKILTFTLDANCKSNENNINTSKAKNETMSCLDVCGGIEAKNNDGKKSKISMDKDDIEAFFK